MRICLSSIILVGILLINAGVCLAGIHPNSGTVSGMTMEIGLGAKAVGLGEAYTAGYGTADMNYWNVGAIGMANGIGSSFTHLEWIAGNRMEHVSIVCPVLELGVLGVNFELMGYGAEKRTLENSDGTFNKEDGTFTGRDIVVGLNYAYNLYHLGKRIGSLGIGSISVGAGLSVINSAYDDRTANAFAGNLGALYKIGDFSAGVSVRNLGTRLKYISEEYGLPMNARVGLSYGILNRMLVVYADVKVPVYQYPSAHVGLEITPVEFVTARVGYKYGFGGMPLGPLSGLSAGLGVNLTSKILQFGSASLDYAFVPYGDLGLTHRISIEFGLGGKESVVEEKEEKKVETNSATPATPETPAKEELKTEPKPETKEEKIEK